MVYLILALVCWLILPVANVKNIAKSRLMSALMDLDEAGDDMRIIMCMTNTTADTDVDVDNTGSYTLDEMDGANYARKTCDNQTVSTDDASDRAEFDFDDVVYTSLGNGTRQAQGILIHEFITDDAGSFPLAWIDFSSIINPGGSTLTIVINAEGAVQLT